MFLTLTFVCLVLIPLCEGHFMPPGTNHVIAVIHGVIAWLFSLVFYVVATHCVKLRAASDLERKLLQTNSVLVRANLLCSLEDLGILDCSKLHVSFAEKFTQFIISCFLLFFQLHIFYYEIQPCLVK